MMTMTTIEAERVYSTYGGLDGVAEAWIEGRIDTVDQRFASEIVDPMTLEAARIRIELRRARNLGWRDESSFAAVHRVMKSEFGIEAPTNTQTMALIEAVRETLPPHPEATITTLRAILRSLAPDQALEAWVDRCSREVVEYLSKQAIVYKVAVAVDDERLWDELEAMIAVRLRWLTQGKGITE